jgi:hypothetical protein
MARHQGDGTLTSRNIISEGRRQTSSETWIPVVHCGTDAKDWAMQGGPVNVRRIRLEGVRVTLATMCISVSHCYTV